MRALTVLIGGLLILLSRYHILRGRGPYRVVMGVGILMVGGEMLQWFRSMPVPLSVGTVLLLVVAVVLPWRTGRT